jgi:hypothetical protein
MAHRHVDLAHDRHGMREQQVVVLQHAACERVLDRHHAGARRAVGHRSKHRFERGEGDALGLVAEVRDQGFF